MHGHHCSNISLLPETQASSSLSPDHSALESQLPRVMSRESGSDNSGNSIHSCTSVSGHTRILSIWSFTKEGCGEGQESGIGGLSNASSPSSGNSVSLSGTSYLSRHLRRRARDTEKKDRHSLCGYGQLFGGVLKVATGFTEHQIFFKQFGKEAKD